MSNQTPDIRDPKVTGQNNDGPTLEELQAQLAEKDKALEARSKELEAAGAELEKANAELFDEDYIKWKTNKGKIPEGKVETGQRDVLDKEALSEKFEGMSKAELVDYVLKTTQNFLTNTYTPGLDKVLTDITKRYDTDISSLKELVETQQFLLDNPEFNTAEHRNKLADLADKYNEVPFSKICEEYVKQHGYSQREAALKEKEDRLNLRLSESTQIRRPLRMGEQDNRTPFRLSEKPNASGTGPGSSGVHNLTMDDAIEKAIQEQGII